MGADFTPQMCMEEWNNMQTIQNAKEYGDVDDETAEGETAD